jgi:16S rRNA (cytosine967-C5)-methyltransferase
VLHEENQAIVQTFLAGHPEFTLLPAGEVLQQQHVALEMGDYLQLSPQLHNTDGFFAAVLERKNA